MRDAGWDRGAGDGECWFLLGAGIRTGLVFSMSYDHRDDLQDQFVRPFKKEKSEKQKKTERKNRKEFYEKWNAKMWQAKRMVGDSK